MTAEEIRRSLVARWRTFANGDMVTMTLIQGVMNMRLWCSSSRVIGYAWTASCAGDDAVAPALATW